MSASQVNIGDKRSVSQSIQNYASTSRSEKLCYFQAKSVCCMAVSTCDVAWPGKQSGQSLSL